MVILDFIFAARPLLHLPIWSIYLVTFYYHSQLSGKQLGWSQILMLFILSLVAAGSYYLNQVYDYESDKLNNKLGFLQKNYISQTQMITLFVILSVISMLGAYFFSWFALFLIGQLVVLGFLYSAPPFKFKDRAVWGLLANSWGYGLIVPLTVMPEMTEHNSGLLGWDNPYYFFCTVASIYLLTVLHDKEGDRKSGKKTLGVLLPTYMVKLLAIVFLFGASFFAWETGFHILLALAVISVLPVIITLFVTNNSLVHLATKLPILLLTLLAGYFYPFYLMFIVALLLLTRIYYARRFKMIYPKLT